MARHSIALLTDVATPQTSPVISTLLKGENYSGNMSLQASIVGASAVGATIQIWGNHQKASAFAAANGGVASQFPGALIATITLGDGTVTQDTVMQEGFTSYPYIYAVVTAISGTNAVLTVQAGI